MPVTREINRSVNYSKNRKLISLYLVIISRKRGSGVEHCPLHNDLVEVGGVVLDHTAVLNTYETNCVQVLICSKYGK